MPSGDFFKIAFREKWGKMKREKTIPLVILDIAEEICHVRLVEIDMNNPKLFHVYLSKKNNYPEGIVDYISSRIDPMFKVMVHKSTS